MTTETIQAAAQPKRFQCRHIHLDGRRCGSPALKQELFCYHHHTTRKPFPPAEITTRRASRTTFDLPLPEDRSAIQHSIGEILRRIANRTVDPRRAGLLLYGLQIASLNLPKPHPKAPELEIVEEITHDPIHGDIAPEAHMYEDRPENESVVRRLLREIEEGDRPATQPEETPNSILPTLQATAHPAPTTIQPAEERNVQPDVVTAGKPSTARQHYRRRSGPVLSAKPPIVEKAYVLGWENQWATRSHSSIARAIRTKGRWRLARRSSSSAPRRTAEPPSSAIRWISPLQITS